MLALLRRARSARRLWNLYAATYRDGRLIYTATLCKFREQVVQKFVYNPEHSYAFDTSPNHKQTIVYKLKKILVLDLIHNVIIIIIKKNTLSNTPYGVYI